jgi:hypothetical protein
MRTRHLRGAKPSVHLVHEDRTTANNAVIMGDSRCLPNMLDSSQFSSKNPSRAREGLRPVLIHVAHALGVISFPSVKNSPFLSPHLSVFLVS